MPQTRYNACFKKRFPANVQLSLTFSEAAEDALDIAFAFGASGSEADAVFKKEKEMINIFIDSLKVHDAQYGVIEYSSDARVHATFGQFSRKERLKAQVNMTRSN